MLYKNQGPCFDFAVLEDPGPTRLLVRIFGIHEWNNWEEVPAFVTAVGFDWLFSQKSWDGLTLNYEVRRVTGRAKAQKNVTSVPDT